MLGHPSIHLGDTARFPLSSRDLGREDCPVCRYRWEAIAFTKIGVVCRRLHDGLERIVSDRIWRTHALEYRRAPSDWLGERRVAIAAMRKRWPRPRGRYCWDPDSKPGPYYVTVLDGARVGVLAGPYLTHLEALDKVETARQLAEKADPRAHWYSYGTIRAIESPTFTAVFGRV